MPSHCPSPPSSWPLKEEKSQVYFGATTTPHCLLHWVSCPGSFRRRLWSPARQSAPLSSFRAVICPPPLPALQSIITRALAPKVSFDSWNGVIFLDGEVALQIRCLLASCLRSSAPASVPDVAACSCSLSWGWGWGGGRGWRSLELPDQLSRSNSELQCSVWDPPPQKLRWTAIEEDNWCQYAWQLLGCYKGSSS